MIMLFILSFEVTGLAPLMIPIYHRIPNLNFLDENEERRKVKDRLVVL